ncbi:MAG: hypothetical protein KDB27_20285 [Planctomycetales bacterium]|nr:hypothetical protein [Planctomycetales bacterium]
MSKQAVVHWIGYLFLRFGVCVLQTMGIESCDRLSRFLAFLAYRVLKIRRQTIDENLRFALPEYSDELRRAIGEAMWHHIILMVCEITQVQRKIHDTNWRDYIYISDHDCRLQVLHNLSGRPHVVVSGHFGNFEVGGVASGMFGFPTYTVARPLDNPYLHQFITAFRGSTGQYMIPKKGSAKQIDYILSTGGNLTLLGDQYAGPKGCVVNFFNRPASCHKAVALFSLLNKAPMQVAYCTRRERPMQFHVGVGAVYDPASDVSMSPTELTQWYSDRLEDMIRLQPEQYWWLHRRWKTRTPQKKKKNSTHRIDEAESTIKQRRSACHTDKVEN